MPRDNSQYRSNLMGEPVQQLSISRSEGSKNWEDNVLDGIRCGERESSLIGRFLASNDFAPATRSAFRHDLRKTAKWFVEANREPFRFERLTVRDIADLREHLRRDKQQAVATLNRLIVTLRRLYGWLNTDGAVMTNPAAPIKELRRQPLAPKALARDEVRRLLREVELRGDIRARAIFVTALSTGSRIGDLAQLELQDLIISERSGQAVFRHGKGGKERTVPLGQSVRSALSAYLDVRPSIQSSRLFVGERGPLGTKGIDKICRKYGAICGVHLHAHRLRHSFANQFLSDSENDLVALAQLLGHESLTTTMRYTIRGTAALSEAVERISY